MCASKQVCWCVKVSRRFSGRDVVSSSKQEGWVSGRDIVRSNKQEMCWCVQVSRRCTSV